MKKDPFLVESFRNVQAKCSRLYAHILNESDLSFSQFVLLVNLRSSKFLTMREASEKLHLTKPAVTHLVDDLVGRHFIERKPHATDRRITLLRLLPSGKKAVEKVQDAAFKFLLDTLAELPETSRKIITDFYDLLSQTLDKNLERKEK